MEPTPRRPRGRDLLAPDEALTLEQVMKARGYERDAETGRWRAIMDSSEFSG